MSPISGSSVSPGVQQAIEKYFNHSSDAEVKIKTTASKVGELTNEVLQQAMSGKQPGSAQFYANSKGLSVDIYDLASWVSEELKTKANVDDVSSSVEYDTIGSFTCKVCKLEIDLK